MRPKVAILTDFPSKNDYALDELDFGTVNVERGRTIHVYLSNEAEVLAKWNLNYVKFPKKATIGHNTTTPWELENMEKTDDPEVFEFSGTQVSTTFLLLTTSSIGRPERQESPPAQGSRGYARASRSEGRGGEEVPAREDLHKVQAQGQRALQEQVQVHDSHWNRLRHHPEGAGIIRGESRLKQ